MMSFSGLSSIASPSVSSSGGSLRSFSGVKWNKPVYAWRTGEQKLIATQFGLRLFDLAADPAEKRDVAAGDPELVQQARAALVARAEQLARAQALPAALDEQDREALKALGYVE